HSPLQVFDAEDETIEAIHYEEGGRYLAIRHKGERAKPESDFKGIPIGDWLYVEGKGFYRRRYDPLLSQERIEANQIASALTHSGKAMQKFLPISLEKKSCQYQLHFDPQGNLHI